jgi:hypothetical protein
MQMGLVKNQVALCVYIGGWNYQAWLLVTNRRLIDWLVNYNNNNNNNIVFCSKQVGVG